MLAEKQASATTEEITYPSDIILVGYSKAGNKELYLKNKLYYVPIDLSKGSINLVSGFEHTKYLLLHNHDDRMVFRLKEQGPKLFVADSLRALGFNPSSEHYLGFEIKSLKPIEIDGLDIAALNLYGKGDESYRPYFTTLKDLKYRK